MTTRAQKSVNLLKKNVQIINWDDMINRIATSSGVAPTVDEYKFWFNFGAMQETPYIGSLVATIIVADLMYRDVIVGLRDVTSTVNASRLPHPFSIVQLPSLRKIKEPLETAYERMSKALDGRVKIPGFDSFIKKLQQGRNIIRFAVDLIHPSEEGEDSYWHINGEQPEKAVQLNLLIRRLLRLMKDIPRDLYSHKTYTTHLTCGNLNSPTKVLTPEEIYRHQQTGSVGTSNKQQGGSRKRKALNPPRSPDSDKSPALVDKIPTSKKKIRQKRPHESGTQKEHLEEDKDLQPRTAPAAVNNPGNIAATNLMNVLTREDEIPIFSKWNKRGGAKEYNVPPGGEHPVIVIETFTSMHGREVVTGPTELSRGKERLLPGDQRYLRPDAHKGRRLSSVILCETTDKYFYLFKLADKKPHFVLNKADAKEYTKKLLNYDIGIKRFCHHHLKQPLKVIADNTITDGIQAGAKADSDFIFVSDKTELFQHYFGNDKLNFDVDFWMKEFDSQKLQGSDASEDTQKRGFKDGHIDIGYGRDGVNEEHTESQKRGKAYLLSLPHLINKKTRYDKLGNLPDCIMSFVEDHVFDEGMPLMSDSERDEKFGRRLRSMMKTKRSRFEAFTLVRQFLCKADKFGAKNFNGTLRHTDGPNDTRPGYRTTAVLSFLVEWGGNVYRLNLICYTRLSVGNYVEKNNYSLMLKQCLLDYKIEWNGNIRYEDFSLNETMSGYKVLGSCLVPNEESLTPTFFERIDKYQGVGTPSDENPKKCSKFPNLHCGNNAPLSSDNMKDLDWTHLQFKSTEGGTIERKVLVVKEFMNRFGYVSSFCYQLNRFNFKFNPTWTQKLQLLYVALLQSSSVQFFHVMDLLMKKDMYRKGDNLFRVYQQKCSHLKLVFSGGPHNRQQPANCNFPVFKNDDSALECQIQSLGRAVSDLDAGEFLNRQTGYLQKRVDAYGIHTIGKIQGLSFASMCVFTGLCKTEHAVSTAKQALCNEPRNGGGSKNSYFDKMQLFMKQFNDSYVFDPNFFQRAWRTTATSIGETPQACENGSCGNWRSTPKDDVFFPDQELYLLKSSSHSVWVKTFGETKWKLKEFPD
jgi:hypothetical protein